MAADKGGGGWGGGAELPVCLELNCGGLSSITILFAQRRGAKSLLAGLSPAFSSSLPLLGGACVFLPIFRAVVSQRRSFVPHIIGFDSQINKSVCSGSRKYVEQEYI